MNWEKKDQQQWIDRKNADKKETWTWRWDGLERQNDKIKDGTFGREDKSNSTGEESKRKYGKTILEDQMSGKVRMYDWVFGIKN